MNYISKLNIIIVIVIFLTSCKNIYHGIYSQNDKNTTQIKKIITRENGEIIEVNEYDQTHTLLSTLKYRNDSSINVNVYIADSNYLSKQILGYVGSNGYDLCILYEDKPINNCIKTFISPLNKETETRTQSDLLQCFLKYYSKTEIEQDSLVIKLLSQNDRKLVIEKKYDSLQIHYDEIWYDWSKNDTFKIENNKEGITKWKDEYEVRKYIVNLENNLTLLNIFTYNNDHQIKNMRSEITDRNSRKISELNVDYINNKSIECIWKYRNWKKASYYEYKYPSQNDYVKMIRYKYRNKKIVKEVEYDENKKITTVIKYYYKQGKLMKKIIENKDFFYNNPSPVKQVIIEHEYIYFP